jgi:flagellar hook-length control protein FliK
MPVTQKSVPVQDAGPVAQEAKIEFINGIKEMVSRFELQNTPSSWQSVLELSSAYLGNTKVRMEMNGTRMLLDILVARAESKELITHSIQELKSALEEQGLSLEECAVDIDQNLSFGKAFVPQENVPVSGQEDAYGDFSTSQVTAEKGRLSGEELVLGQEQINCFA